jgi:hypothetical protein
VLFKITNVCIKHSQKSAFDVGKAGPELSVVICGLCKLFDGLTDMFKMQFFSSCPFTIPIFTGDYKDKPMLLKQMTTLIGLYAMVLVRSQDNTTFSLETAWKWVTRVFNNLSLR